MRRQGVAYAAAAYMLWGLFPLYFMLLRAVPPAEVLGHRIVWSLAVVLGLLALRRHFAWLPQALRNRRVLGGFAASATLIALNWFIYIWAVANERVVDASLGYFITPLMNVLMGTLLLHERLRPGQWLAVALAALGVVWLALGTGTVPWIALLLAATFSTYGLLRKTAPLGALEGLTLETLLLAPLALAGLLWAGWQGHAVFAQAPLLMQALLVAAGPLTALPLLLFAAGARRIPLSVLGMLQYIGPTLQFALGVWFFGEPFGGARLAGFALIWTACAVFTWDALRSTRAAAQAGAAPAPALTAPDLDPTCGASPLDTLPLDDEAPSPPSHLRHPSPRGLP
jgi:chloramphenicol-sensitive protein RarD